MMMITHQGSYYTSESILPSPTKKNTQKVPREGKISDTLQDESYQISEVHFCMELVLGRKATLLIYLVKLSFCYSFSKKTSYK